jgi:hypothetical protein
MSKRNYWRYKKLHVVLEAKEVAQVNIRREQLQTYTGEQEVT